jgi:hypothetical protein
MSCDLTLPACCPPAQPIPIPESLRRVGRTGKAPVHMQYMAQYWGPRGWAVFSRLREIWAGRLAMVGFMAACVSEVRGWLALLRGLP